MCGRSFHSSTKSFTYGWNSPSNSQAICVKCISTEQRALPSGARCSKHKLLCKPQAPCWGHTLRDACGSPIALSLVICWALGNGIITPYLLLLTQKRGCLLSDALFCLLPHWSGCLAVSLAVAYQQTQARWLKSSICVKIYVRNREVKGSKYRH